MARRRVFVQKALVVAVVGCMGTILAAGQRKEQSTARTIAAKKDSRAEINAHAAEWLNESDVPSVAVAYIEHRKVAWTEVHGEQSPGVSATGKTLYNMASLTKPVTAENQKTGHNPQLSFNSQRIDRFDPCPRGGLRIPRASGDPLRSTQRSDHEFFRLGLIR
jgi:hypothetical protein